MVIAPRSTLYRLATFVLAVACCSTQLAGSAPARRLLRRELRLAEEAWAEHTGSDPYRVLPLPGGSSFLVLLRGESRVVVAGGAASAISRETPRSPASWDLVDGRFLLVGGELSNRIRCFDVVPGDLRPRWDLEIPGIASVRDLVYVEESRRLFVLDAFRGLLVGVVLPEGWREARGPAITPSGPPEELPIGPEPVCVRHIGGYLIVDVLLQHALVLIPMKHGRPELSRALRIEHDGPIWSFDAVQRDEWLWIAACGVENRQLDRTSGEFGFVDSFLFLYRVPRDPSASSDWKPEAIGTMNLSEVRVVTPKAVRLAVDGNELRLRVTGYGGDRMVDLRVANGMIESRNVRAVPPGITDFVESDGTLLAADPLLDRVYRIRPNHEPAEIAWSGPPAGSARRRLGEVLFYTTLLTPGNKTEGELSRFTCETCHFEGGIDGRTHFTGREHVFATTKPLRGLANNVPLFSRAGDATLASMVEAEFRVANQQRLDRFELSRADHPWLAEVPGLSDPVGPEEQRFALLEFLAGQQHLPNPWRAQGLKLPPAAVLALPVFRRHCADCHQPLTSTREDGRVIPFAEWRAWLESDGNDLVWGAPFLLKTGIEPYVDRAGARVPSLRRVAAKAPYFTNGSSPTLRDALLRFRFCGATAWHDATRVEDSEAVEALTNEEIEGLLALLQFF